VEAGACSVTSALFAIQHEDAPGDDEQDVLGHIGNQPIDSTEGIPEGKSGLGLWVDAEADLIAHEHRRESVGAAALDGLHEIVDIHRESGIAGDPRPEGVDENDPIDSKGRRKTLASCHLDRRPVRRSASAMPGDPGVEFGVTVTDGGGRHVRHGRA
jgi:hypothetical protein